MNPVPTASTKPSARATLKRTVTQQAASRTTAVRLQPLGRSHSEADALTLPAKEARCVSLGMLGRFAPEFRNDLYSLLLLSDNAFIIEPSAETAGAFELRKGSHGSHHESIKALQSLQLVSTGVRREARTFFYWVNRFILRGYEYEYLPVFVRWLEAVGSECRAVLKKVQLHGCMWYQPSSQLTQRYHELLRGCEGAQKLRLTMNLRHFCEASLPELNAYLNYMGPEPHDGPMPEVDVAEWGRTIVGLTRLEMFELELVWGADRDRIRMGKERSLDGLSSERGNALALNIQRRLKGAVRDLCDRDVVVRVRYAGEYEKNYYVAWAGAIQPDWPLSRGS
jgi:hypothetical protein